MSYNDKKEVLKFIVVLNLIIGFYNLYLFAYSNLLLNLIIGSMNIGVWVFFRDMKLINIILKNHLFKNYYLIEKELDIYHMKLA